MSNQYESQALVSIEHVKDRKDTKWYFGKRIVYIHKAKKGFRVSLFDNDKDNLGKNNECSW